MQTPEQETRHRLRRGVPQHIYVRQKSTHRSLWGGAAAPTPPPVSRASHSRQAPGPWLEARGLDPQGQGRNYADPGCWMPGQSQGSNITAIVMCTLLDIQGYVGLPLNGSVIDSGWGVGYAVWGRRGHLYGGGYRIPHHLR